MTAPDDEQTIVVLGESGSGKSSLTLQFTLNRFVDEHDPSIEEVDRKQVCVDDREVVLNVFDTAQTDDFWRRDQYFRRALLNGGFFIMFSIVDRWTFEHVKDHFERVFRFAEDMTMVPPIFLIGSRHDMREQRRVDESEGYDLAREFNVRYFECSAKTGHRVDEVFAAMVRRVRKYKIARANLQGEERGTKKGCSLM